jgi:ADP-dependent NAD(P)H-hydrate dehydratase / NAD(P)H-hydrate epimerase
MKVLTAEQMRQAEQRCSASGTTTDILMENAGRAVAEAIKNEIKTGGVNILILIGPGNNGGDGLVTGRYLRAYGYGVTFYCIGNRADSDKNVILAREHSLVINYLERISTNRFEEDLKKTDILLDALLGTGKNRPITGKLAEVLDIVAEEKKRRPEIKVISLDLPSGLDADTGAVDPKCLFADETITLGFPKTGLFNMPGVERVGKINVVDIGIMDNTAESTIAYITVDGVKTVLPKRPMISNKGSFGKVMVVAGSPRYTGAAYLACSGAMRAGAGLVTAVVSPEIQQILAAKLNETTFLPLPEDDGQDAAEIIEQEISSYQVLLAGPGLGQSEAAANLVKKIIFSNRHHKLRIILDADALNILAKEGAAEEVWQRITGDVILTPHPGEMSRMIGITVEKIQSNRIGTASRKAAEWNKVIVLKGAYTVIAAPDSKVAVSPFANPGLASAGTGDVLAGIISGLAAQGIPLFDAAVAGVYIHGTAGEMVTCNIGDTGMIASDLLTMIPLAIKAIKE